ncbi:hypothetical protein DFH06DRAFT_262227 [Mycena polygramma]|nr:hypothetical protein DFH06DRAFT_262227 [Mycena polygramma]
MSAGSEMRVTHKLDLPVELEREIFELAASTDVRTALRLAIVARRVQAWVEPIIYSRVVVAHPPGVSAQTQYSRSILRTARRLKSSKEPNQIPALRFIRTIPFRPASFFARHVKCLQIGNLSEPELITILSACTGISQLGWWSSQLTPPVAATFNSLVLRRLSIDSSFDFAKFYDIARSPFTNVTHLDISFEIYFSQATPLGSPPVLGRFPALTHLSVLHHVHTSTTTATWCDAVLKACPRLNILLRFSDTLYYEELSHVRPRHPDLRVVVMASPVGSWTAHWVHDSWPLAENIVRERRSLVAAEKAADVVSEA